MSLEDECKSTDRLSVWCRKVRQAHISDVTADQVLAAFDFSEPTTEMDVRCAIVECAGYDYSPDDDLSDDLVKEIMNRIGTRLIKPKPDHVYVEMSTNAVEHYIYARFANKPLMDKVKFELAYRMERLKLLPHRLKRPLVFWWQRRRRGFDDSVTWSLDQSLAQLIAPRLKRFRELSYGCPSDMTHEQWYADLDKMIAAFEWAASDARWFLDFEEEEASYKKHQEGLDLFAKHYWGMWT